MGEPTKDNYIRPEDKKVWGFSGSADEIKVAPEKATDAKSVETKSTSKSGSGNGSGGSK